MTQNRSVTSLSGFVCTEGPTPSTVDGQGGPAGWLATPTLGVSRARSSDSHSNFSLHILSSHQRIQKKKASPTKASPVFLRRKLLHGRIPALCIRNQAQFLGPLIKTSLSPPCIEPQTTSCKLQEAPNMHDGTGSSGRSCRVGDRKQIAQGHGPKKRRKFTSDPGPIWCVLLPSTSQKCSLGGCWLNANEPKSHHITTENKHLFLQNS